MNCYRQGDLLFVQLSKTEAEKLIGDAKPVARENGRIILAHGETTGHMHAVIHSAAKLFQVEAVAEQRILIAPVPVRVYHEEHAAVSLPVGAFRVIRQREYSPEEIRRVMD